MVTVDPRLAILVLLQTLTGPPYNVQLSGPLTPSSQGSFVVKIIATLGVNDYGWSHIRFDDVANNTIPFVISIRPDIQLVVRNTFADEVWQSEDREGSFLFTMGEEFVLSIVCETEGYQVFFNKQPYFYFKHRLPLEHVTKLMFEGPMLLKKVEILQHMPAEVITEAN